MNVQAETKVTFTCAACGRSEVVTHEGVAHPRVTQDLPDGWRQHTVCQLHCNQHRYRWNDGWELADEAQGSGLTVDVSKLVADTRREAEAAERELILKLISEEPTRDYEGCGKSEDRTAYTFKHAIIWRIKETPGPLE